MQPFGCHNFKRNYSSTVPEFIDPVFTKTSPKRSFSVIQNERFGLVFAKTGSILSGTGDLYFQIRTSVMVLEFVILYIFEIWD
jgi:hypothetical protein